MIVLAPDGFNPGCDGRARLEMICAAFESGVPSFFNLENCLDAIERGEWGGLWW
ncbi:MULTISPECIES: hypothetical protein [unclassified Roseovarius]|uniref:hypothetical protein n=1 Tax=unclassified Roseovarius TaxID=2614913 RepID=UPI00274001DA|nr:MULTISPECIES: hypothetical protein [unclassified Roseovarius]